ncbi:MAG: putative bifunctional diguanylate cyclase/phosphodiesterase [Pontibacterium sp.]
MNTSRIASPLLRNLLGGNVSRIFVVLILVFSSFITLLLTGLQLWRDYHYDLNLLDQRFEQVRISNVESISRSVWTYNLPSLSIQMEGLLRQQDISYIAVEDADSKLLMSVGQNSTQDTLSKSYALSYSHRNHPLLLGQLHIKASLEGIYNRLWDTFWVILVSQAIKTFLVTMFIIYLFRQLISRHLKHIVDQLSISYATTRPILLERPETPLNTGDELDTLVRSLNRLHHRLEQEHQHLERLANFDSLTDLPNRHQLKTAIEQRIEAGKPFWLALLDINDFKNINDTLGHQSGDRVLREIGQRFNTQQSEHQLFGRLGGDEFACIFDGVLPAEDLAAVIIKQFEAPFFLQAMRMKLDTSIGLVAYPSQSVNAQQLMKFADIAMYHCKNSRCEYSVFSPALDMNSVQRLALMTEVKVALDNREFLLHYQPQVSSHTNKISGIEALVRWQHPAQGYIPPDQFIPSLEMGGHINAFTGWVLEQALTDYPHMRSALGRDIALSINISALNLLDDSFLSSIDAILKRYPTRPGLIMEITENALMDDPERARNTMLALTERGIEFSIDDYGTGYSSMTHLSRLPVSELKIDKSFISNISTEKRHQTIVQSTIGLAHNLGLRVVAEGCETEQAITLLKRLNCNNLQGYYFFRPMPLPHLLPALTQQEALSCTESSPQNSFL